MYGYDANGNATACTEADAANYVSTKSGFGFYDMASIGTDNAKWNVQVPEDATTAFAPLAPTADFIANSKYEASAWSIFPLEGIVYYNTAITNAVLTLDAKYTSDDTEKPNFYIVHTRNGYDRPDKGDCNKTTVCVAGENFNLFRYDTALCDVKIMTYKGFEPRRLRYQECKYSRDLCFSSEEGSNQEWCCYRQGWQDILCSRCSA